MSSNLQIQIDYNNTEYTPGDTISGKVLWSQTSETKSVELRLFWYTSGKGTQDIKVIEELSWPASQGQANFSFTLPNEPYSFSGTLVSLSWALEAVLLPEETSEKYQFQLTPNGQTILLNPVEAPKTGSKNKNRFTTNR